MEILTYNEMDPQGLSKQVDKIVGLLQAGDFNTADVKKLKGTPYYRAKLSSRDRLLFTLGRYNESCCILLLEVIKNHAYEKSRFLKGTRINEDKIDFNLSIEQLPNKDLTPLVYRNPERSEFHLLDKIISFDDIQHEIFNLSPPLIVIGSAGSGKTVLTLEKLKHMSGDILYVTLSPYLAENARNLYYSNEYENDRQNIDFLSFKELLETIRVPEGGEINYREFESWFERYKHHAPIKNAHQLYEEFNGVLTGYPIDRAYLDRQEYLGLGVRRSIFLNSDREAVYDIFEKYLDFLKDGKFYSPNMVSHEYIRLCRPKYDFVVADEVQDLTNIQIHLILKMLRLQGNFVLCGDANQIVHPNFFSWSAVKSMFYIQRIKSSSSKGDDRHREIIRVLNANYRNSLSVTDLANRLLLIKNARFGSIDRESNYLVKCVSETEGSIEFLAEKEKTKQELNTKTGRSARTAVIVMRSEDKKAARLFFKTPLLFAIHEVKGLEYENIILLNFVSGHAREFNAIVEGVTSGDLTHELKYARARDKEDKSREAYKFFINALYVAITRGITNVYIIEHNPNHRLFTLLGVYTRSGEIKVSSQVSTSGEWQQEAHRLELQGKTEQAEEIRKTILAQKEVPWQVMTPQNIDALKKEALDPKHYNRKAKQLLFDYAVLHQVPELFESLAALKFNPAKEPEKFRVSVENKYHQDFQGKKLTEIKKKVKTYGVNFRNPFNQTPLMIAAHLGLDELVKWLIANGASRRMTDNWGRTPLQIALRQAYRYDFFARDIIGRIYADLAHSSIKVKLEGQMIKIDNKLMEFFLLNSMIAQLQDLLRKEVKWKIPSFETATFLSALQYFPDHVIAEYRKKRPYLSAILSKNEINGSNPYNRKLFVRIERGYYIINPNLEIAIEDDWVNIYDLIHIDLLEKESRDSVLHQFIRLIREIQGRSSSKIKVR
jgi:ankyrin repeat protein